MVYHIADDYKILFILELCNLYSKGTGHLAINNICCALVVKSNNQQSAAEINSLNLLVKYKINVDQCFINDNNESWMCDITARLIGLFNRATCAILYE